MGLLKKAKKAVKKVVKSPIGKAALIAGAVAATGGFGAAALAGEGAAFVTGEAVSGAFAASAAELGGAAASFGAAEAASFATGEAVSGFYGASAGELAAASASYGAPMSSAEVLNHLRTANTIASATRNVANLFGSPAPAIASASPFGLAVLRLPSDAAFSPGGSGRAFQQGSGATDAAAAPGMSIGAQLGIAIASGLALLVLAKMFKG